MARAIDCKTCVHEKVCDLWVQQERQDASCFCLDGCDYFEPTLTQPNEPLTLEVLGEMEGKPFYDCASREWYIVDYVCGSKLYTAEGVYFAFCKEETKGRFYRRPPEGEL